MERIGMMDGKKVKVVIKEIYKHTAACEACRVRKRKCDGKAPCSYCESKNLQCQFAEQRKRGPKKPRTLPPAETSLGAANLEGQMLDIVEAKNYFDNAYVDFLKLLIPMNFAQAFTPETPSHKIQTYAALAIASRVLGDIPKSKVYISSARLLAGSVFDCPDPSTISAMLIMSQYWYLVLDMTLAAYYASLACNLAKASPLEIKGRLGAHCQVAMIMLTDNVPTKHRVQLLKNVAKELNTGDFSDKNYGNIVEVMACLLEGLGLNLSFPDLATLSNTFNLLDNCEPINEETRLSLLNTVQQRQFSEPYPDFISQESAAAHSSYLRDIYAPSFTAIIEWKSGHIAEALAYTVTSLEGLLRLEATKSFYGILSKYSNLSKFVFLAKFLYEQKQYFLAKQMCELVKQICVMMRPEYDFLYNLTQEFIDLNLEPIRPSYAPNSETLFTIPNSPLSSPSTSPTQYISLNTSPDFRTYVDTTNFTTHFQNPNFGSSPNSSSSPNSPSPSNFTESSPPHSSPDQMGDGVHEGVPEFSLNIIGLDTVQALFN